MPNLSATTRSWRNVAFLHVLVAVSAITLSANRAASADPPPLDKLNQSAQEAYDQGKFRKAATGWTKALRSMEDAGQKDIFFEACLKRLGQAYKKLEHSVDAYKTLKQAFEMCNALGVQDNELAQELSEVSTSYRPLDVAQLGQATATAFKKANVTDIGLIRGSDSSKMQVDLEDRYEKHVDNDTVDGIALDKHVTVDIDEASDGTVSMKNIKGFRIHAKEVNLWVNLLQAVIKPADAEGGHPAEVTAGKMGVTKTVNASLPAKGFEPLGELLVQLRAMVTPMAVKFASASVNSPNAAGSPTSDANAAVTTPPGNHAANADAIETAPAVSPEAPASSSPSAIESGSSEMPPSATTPDTSGTSPSQPTSPPTIKSGNSEMTQPAEN